MNLLAIQSIISIIAGLFIFIKPELLNYIIAAYLIFAGVSGLWLMLM